MALLSFGVERTLPLVGLLMTIRRFQLEVEALLNADQCKRRVSAK